MNGLNETCPFCGVILNSQNQLYEHLLEVHSRETERQNRYDREHDKRREGNINQRNERINYQEDINKIKISDLLTITETMKKGRMQALNGQTQGYLQNNFDTSMCPIPTTTAVPNVNEMGDYQFEMASTSRNENSTYIHPGDLSRFLTVNFSEGEVSNFNINNVDLEKHRNYSNDYFNELNKTQVGNMNNVVSESNRIKYRNYLNCTICDSPNTMFKSVVTARKHFENYHSGYDIKNIFDTVRLPSNKSSDWQTLNKTKQNRNNNATNAINTKGNTEIYKNDDFKNKYLKIKVQCLVCKKVFNNRQDAYNHSLENHPQWGTFCIREVNYQKRENKSGLLRKCKICGEVIKVSQVSQHRKVIHPGLEKNRRITVPFHKEEILAQPNVMIPNVNSKDSQIRKRDLSSEIDTESSNTKKTKQNDVPTKSNSVIDLISIHSEDEISESETESQKRRKSATAKESHKEETLGSNSSSDEDEDSTETTLIKLLINKLKDKKKKQKHRKDNLSEVVKLYINGFNKKNKNGKRDKKIKPILKAKHNKSKGKKPLVKLYLCVQCDTHFINEDTCKAHIIRKHKKGITVDPSSRELCKRCDRYFSKMTINRHNSDHHEKGLKKKGFVIVKCEMERLESNKETVRIGSKSINAAISTKVGRRPKIISVLYKCTRCDLHFNSKSHIYKHYLPATREHKEIEKTDTVECFDCKLYFTKKTLKFHRKIHAIRRNVTARNFKIISWPLLDSKKVVNKPNPNAKDKNNEIITVDDTEEENVTNHVDNRIYKCVQCDICFIEKNTLIHHMRKSEHNIEQHACRLCNLNFSLESLVGHVNIQHGTLGYGGYNNLVVIDMNNQNVLPVEDKKDFNVQFEEVSASNGNHYNDNNDINEVNVSNSYSDTGFEENDNGVAEIHSEINISDDESKYKVELKKETFEENNFQNENDVTVTSSRETKTNVSASKVGNIRSSIEDIMKELNEVLNNETPLEQNAQNSTDDTVETALTALLQSMMQKIKTNKDSLKLNRMSLESQDDSLPTTTVNPVEVELLNKIEKNNGNKMNRNASESNAKLVEGDEVKAKHLSLVNIENLKTSHPTLVITEVSRDKKENLNSNTPKTANKAYLDSICNKKNYITKYIDITDDTTVSYHVDDVKTDQSIKLNESKPIEINSGNNKNAQVSIVDNSNDSDISTLILENDCVIYDSDEEHTNIKAEIRETCIVKVDTPSETKDTGVISLISDDED